MSNRYFTPNTFEFLRQLRANNETNWFNEHRADYQRHVRDPAIRFVVDVAEPMTAISPHLAPDSSRPGRSVFSIRRGVRFGGDPYKTHTGLHLRHAGVDGSRSPGFYLRVEPANCFLSAGVRRPLAEEAAVIRRAIAACPDDWLAVTGGAGLAEPWQMHGQLLARPAAGFDPEHPLMVELRRRDFTVRRRFTQREVASSGFLDVFVDQCRQARPVLEFLCGALGLDC